MPKKHPAKIFRYRRAFALLGLRARQPNVHGTVAMRYEIMKISCQPWSSVEVTYVHPPQVTVRKRPTPATNFGNDEFGRAVKMYQRNTRAKRGPAEASASFSIYGLCHEHIPEVMAIKSWKTDRSGYRSPIVAETDGNHSCG